MKVGVWNSEAGKLSTTRQDVLADLAVRQISGLKYYLKLKQQILLQ
jgi:hypothetical protein